MELHWQLLVKQWTGRFSISLKTTRETMKLKRGSTIGNPDCQETLNAGRLAMELPFLCQGGFKCIDAWCNLPWTDELPWGLITNSMRITKGFLPGIPFPRRFSFTVSSRESFFTKAFPLCTEMPFHEGPFTNYKYIYEITYMKLHIWNYIYEITYMKITYMKWICN